MLRNPGKRKSASDINPASTVEQAIADLERSSRDLLVERWRPLYRSDPPKGLGRRLLIGAIAYELQMRQTGRSPSSLRRRLKKHVVGPLSGIVASRATRTLKPGARLIREWNGSSHIVEVVEDSFLWNGKRYRSLSAIARAITGTRWSGPRFFGLDPEDAQ
jgi:hypothetical protein